MPPDQYCSAHSNLMLTVGAIDEKAKRTCEDVRDIKAILERWEEESKTEAIALAEQKTKNKIIWGSMGAAVIAGISAGVHILIKKLGG